MDTTKTKKTLEKMLFIVDWIERYEYWIESIKKDMDSSVYAYKLSDISDCNVIIMKHHRKIMILKSVYFKLNLTL